MPLSDAPIYPRDWTLNFIPRRLVFIQEANGTGRELNLTHRLRSSAEANLRVGRQSTLTLGLYLDSRSEYYNDERLMLAGMAYATSIGSGVGGRVRFDICSDDRAFFGQGLLTMTSGRWVPTGELLDLSLTLLVGPNGSVIQVHDLVIPAVQHAVTLCCPNCGGTGWVSLPRHAPKPCPACQAKAPAEPVAGSSVVAPPTKPKRRFR